MVHYSIKKVMLIAGLVLTVLSLTLSPVQAANKLVFSQTSDGTTLDITKGNSIPDQNIAKLMSEGLVRTKSGELTPGIAKSWDISKDGKIYTFHLRSSKWSDGTKLTAYDFEYSIKRLMDPKVASPYSFIGMTIENAGPVNKGEMGLDKLGVKAVDDLTLKIILENPADYFLSSLALSNFSPVRKDYVDKYGQEFATSADKLLYNGPFYLAEYTPLSKKIFKKNPYYWNAGAVSLDEIEVIVVEDPMTALQMYQTGDLHFAEVPETLYPNYKDNAFSYMYSIEWIGFNKRKKDSKPWLANMDFIKAINLSIDREVFTALSSRGLNLPAQRYIMPILMGKTKSYGEDYPLNFYDKKAQKTEAVKHLKKAMQTLNISNPADIEVSYQITSNNPQLKRQAEVLQSMITKNLGITFNITQVEYKHHWASLKKGDYEMAWQGWVPDYNSPFSYLEIWQTDGYYAARCGYSDAGFDSQIKKALESTDRNKSLDYYYSAEQQLLKTAPMVPLHMRQKAVLINPNVKGLDFYFIGYDIDASFAKIK
ncbi:peptide ABC transporter substrate-binding protein [bacterium]|nr:peptide ABC transporter substrate-binding protein [bacterium]